MTEDEAKTELSRILDKIESGEVVVITRNGKPVARMVLYRGEPKKRVLGGAEGKVWISPDFDDEVDPLTWGLDEIPD